MQTNICCIYLSGPKKTKKNLSRILSHILSFMFLQNKYKKCDYCLLLLSFICVVCVLFLLLSFPLRMTLSLKFVPRQGERVPHDKHYKQGWYVVYSSLVLSWLLLCCLFLSFIFYLFFLSL